jgi:hypothetical protein
VCRDMNFILFLFIPLRHCEIKPEKHLSSLRAAKCGIIIPFRHCKECEAQRSNPESCHTSFFFNNSYENGNSLLPSLRAVLRRRNPFFSFYSRAVLHKSTAIPPLVIARHKVPRQSKKINKIIHKNPNTKKYKLSTPNFNLFHIFKLQYSFITLHISGLLRCASHSSQ